MKIFLLLPLFLSTLAINCPDIPREQCKPCPPCARVPRVFIYGKNAKKIPSRATKEIYQKKKYRHFSQDMDELQKLMIIRDTDEVFSSQTIDLSHYKIKMKSSLKKEIETITTTKRPPSTIPSATPPAPTKVPRMWMKFTKYLKKRRIPKVFTVQLPSSTTVFLPTSTISTTHSTEPPKETITISSNGIADEVPVIPTGYKTNPNFAPDEVTIEDEKCNDMELQKILVEGMKIDDSVMSKRSIGAILSASKRNNVSILCSDQEVAFRLVARKHCQLTAGKAVCVLFIL